MTRSLASFAAAVLLLSAGPAAAQKITAAYGQPSIFNAPVWIAADAGHFKKNGLEVELVALPGARITDGLTAGSVQFIMSSASTPSLNRLAGGDALLVAIVVEKTPFDLVADPKIGSIPELKGKIGALSALTDFTALAAELVLKRHGLDSVKDTVRLGTFRTDADRMAAVLSGTAQFALINLDFRSTYEKAGLKRLAALQDEPETDFILSSVVTTQRYNQREPNTVYAFVKSIGEAMHTLHTDQEKALDIIAKYSPRPRPELLESYKLFMAEIMPKRPYMNPASVEKSLRAMAFLNPAATTLDPKAMYDTKAIDRLQAEGVLDKLWQ